MEFTTEINGSQIIYETIITIYVLDVERFWIWSAKKCLEINLYQTEMLWNSDSMIYLFLFLIFSFAYVDPRF